MVKFLLWTIGLIIGVPIAILALNVFLIYVVYPWTHTWNVSRMDAKNDLVWEQAVARVVTVEAKLGTKERTETLTTNIVCYEGYFATAWNLKNGGPRTGSGSKSIGFETLQTKLPTGGTLDINLRWLCREAFRTDVDELPLKLEYSDAHIVGPEQSLYCKFHSATRRSAANILHTDAGRVSFPYIVALKEQPLRSLATRSDMGSSETPSISSGFTRRWGTDMRRSDWKSEKGCWGDGSGVCNETMTNYCGKNPK